VVADVPELLTELLGELFGARLALVEQRQDARPQRMSERGDDPLVRDAAGY
jgi:hypothetical protein